MKTKWLIEDFDQDNNYQRLAEEVKRQGYECEVITYVPFQGGNYNKYNDDDCVLMQGSLNLVSQLLGQKKWIPGAWLNLQEYQCSYYYSFLGQYLFNDDYIMISRNDFKRVKDAWFSRFGKEECLFIRPSSGFKTFTGKVFSQKHFDKDWEWVEEFTEPMSLLIITSPKEIKTEWRFIAAQNEIISGSMYKKDGASKYKREWPDEAIDLATIIAKEFHPDPLYCIDICQGMDDKLYLLEVGSFSCAGLYSCDVKPIVEKASELALLDWEELHG